MTKKIEVEHGAVKRLAEKFGVSMETVKRALNYTTNSELSHQIRQEAVLGGGVVLESEHVRKQLDGMDPAKRQACVEALRNSILMERPYKRMKIAKAIERVKSLRLSLLGTPMSEALAVLCTCGEWVVELENMELMTDDLANLNPNLNPNREETEEL